jgi:hypothetical protein
MGASAAHHARHPRGHPGGSLCAMAARSCGARHRGHSQSREGGGSAQASPNESDRRFREPRDSRYLTKGGSMSLHPPGRGVHDSGSDERRAEGPNRTSRCWRSDPGTRTSARLGEGHERLVPAPGVPRRHGAPALQVGGGDSPRARRAPRAAPRVQDRHGAAGRAGLSRAPAGQR